jgi:ATP-dependent DNA helicase RecG
MQKKLAGFGIHNLKDLLFHLPSRYEDRTRIVPIASCLPGQRAVIEARVELSETVFRGRRSLLVKVADDTGLLTLRFFHFSKQQQAQFEKGTVLHCFGEIRKGKSGLEMIHPEYRILREKDENTPAEHLTAIYPSTEGIGQGRWRLWMRQALGKIRKLEFPELMPEALLKDNDLPDLVSCLQILHQPSPDIDVDALNAGKHPAIRRLALEELLAHQVSLRQIRLEQKADPAPVLKADAKLLTAFREQLSFSLTAAQERVLKEIDRDLNQSHPMLRLLQGDVGSGKTVVAAMSALAAISNGFQVAIMAPTEILAEQHFSNFTNWFAPMGLRLGWLSGSLGVAAKRKVLAEIANGEVDVIIGTHALFQESVEYKKLGFCIIDEQHRFGVHQRLALREKSDVLKHGLPHQLIMTATPIPRTLAMSAYADLDVSVIDELPPGRKPVITVVIAETRRSEVLQRIESIVSKGRQVYWVCPLVEESEKLQCQAAEITAQKLAEIFPQLRIALVHGRLKSSQKDLVMQAFNTGEVDLLVATTVIEVGVDVPNANLMVIENAERLGLSQLHQLRGRIGRGADAGFCVLMYKAPLSDTAKLRLQTMRETTDGFKISEKDLQIRGPGELLGTRQTGLMQLRVADLIRDAHLIPELHTYADMLLNNHPKHAKALVRRWLGDRIRYGMV